MYKRSTFLIGFSIFLFCCESNEHIRKYRLPKNTMEGKNKSQKIHIEFQIGWIKPQSWKEVKGHTMRYASFNAPYVDGNADISITTFEGNSGGIVPNVNRWLGQIGIEPYSSDKILNIEEKMKSKLGEYSYFKLINEKNNETAILAAIFELKNRTIFIKLSSTIKGLRSIETEFIGFCSSIFIKG